MLAFQLTLGEALRVKVAGIVLKKYMGDYLTPARKFSAGFKTIRLN